MYATSFGPGAVSRVKGKAIPMKVLIVDHAAPMRRLIHDLLLGHFPGVLIEEAETTLDAYHRCATFIPHLLIIDIYAPSMNGIQTLVELKHAYPQMIIIVFSDFCSAEQRKHCLEAGAEELIRKGDQLYCLLKTINHTWQEGPNVGALHHKRGRHELITGMLSYDQTEHHEHLIVLQMNQVRKEELLTTYDELLRNIWQSTLPTLGRVMFLTIVKRACTITRQQYPFIGELTVTRDGFNLYALADHIEEIEPDALRKGLQALVTNLIFILGKLTGNCMARQLVHQNAVHVLS